MENPELFCVHILGPDDVHAAPSKEAAEERMAKLNDLFAKWTPAPGDDPHGHWPTVRAVVAPWPWSAERHRDDLANWEGEW